LVAPARIATAGVLNLNDRSAAISTFTASWRGLNAVLEGPAVVATQPGITVRHLALGLNGAAIRADGTLTPRINASLAVQNLPASLAAIFAPTVTASGTVNATAHITGTQANPAGTFTLNGNAIRMRTGPAAALAPADFSASASLANHEASLNARLAIGPDVQLTAAGLVPLSGTGTMALHLTGSTDLRLTDAYLAAAGTTVRGIVTPDVTVTGTPSAPLAAGTIRLAGGSVENIGSGLNLTHISAMISGQGRELTLQSLTAIAGPGTISGHGSVALGTPGLPIDLALNAENATPVASDIVTETVNAALTLKGALRGALALGGRIDITGANINIPKSLPPAVANLPIRNRGEPPPPPPPPAPDVALDLLIHANDRIFVRGDGLFAELGGRLRITGTAAHPDPEGGFTLIRGDFSLAGRSLQFTQGTVGFNGDGFMPTLDLEATATNSSVTSTLIVGGTAAAPTITLTSTPPLPSDEILANLLFGTGTQNLSAFQAASLAAALAQLSGVGGGANPLDSVRSALGLDELSLGGSGNGPPSIQAGRYVAPGVYVGAQQATNGQGTQATVQINLYKGLKLQTATGTSTAGTGASSSIGLTYQFNY
jgi:translocation and assembly module TamB